MLLFINDAGLIISCMHGHAPDLTRILFGPDTSV